MLRSHVKQPRWFCLCSAGFPYALCFAHLLDSLSLKWVKQSWKVIKIRALGDFHWVHMFFPHVFLSWLDVGEIFLMVKNISDKKVFSGLSRFKDSENPSWKCQPARQVFISFKLRIQGKMMYMLASFLKLFLFFGHISKMSTADVFVFFVIH